MNVSKMNTDNYLNISSTRRIWRFHDVLQRHDPPQELVKPAGRWATAAWLNNCIHLWHKLSLAVPSNPFKEACDLWSFTSTEHWARQCCACKVPVQWWFVERPRVCNHLSQLPLGRPNSPSKLENWNTTWWILCKLLGNSGGEKGLFFFLRMAFFQECHLFHQKQKWMTLSTWRFHILESLGKA